MALPMFSTCLETALEALTAKGVRILTYIDDWLILDASWQEAEAHTALVIYHVTQLGLTVNPTESAL